jgi:hypothetical protein
MTQSFEPKDAAKMPMMLASEPTRKVTLKYPASVSRPEKTPIKKYRKIYMEPTHDTVDDGSLYVSMKWL